MGIVDQYMQKILGIDKKYCNFCNIIVKYQKCDIDSSTFLQIWVYDDKE